MRTVDRKRAALVIAGATMLGCAGILGIHDPELDPAGAGQDGSSDRTSLGDDGDGGVAPTGLAPMAAPVLVVTFAGTGAVGHDDGPGATATFNLPQTLVFDGNNKILYVADAGNRSIRAITMSGEVSTVFGTNGAFGSPRGLALDPASGYLYVSDYENPAVFRVDLPGKTLTTTVIGDYVDGSVPGDLVVDSTYLYVSEIKDQRIRRIPLSGGAPETVVDAGATAALGFWPEGLASGTPGVFIADNYARRVLLLERGSMTITKLAGGVGGTPVDGPGDVATFGLPRSVALDSLGNVYVSDSSASTIRKLVLLADGGTDVSTFAGGGKGGPGIPIDGPANVAQFNQQRGIALDNANNIYVADIGHNRIRKIIHPGPRALAVSWSRLADPTVTRYVASAGAVTCTVDVPDATSCVLGELTSGAPTTITVTAYAGAKVVATGTTSATPE